MKRNLQKLDKEGNLQFRSIWCCANPLLVISSMQWAQHIGYANSRSALEHVLSEHTCRKCSNKMPFSIHMVRVRSMFLWGIAHKCAICNGFPCSFLFFTLQPYWHGDHGYCHLRVCLHFISEYLFMNCKVQVLHNQHTTPARRGTEPY